MSTAIWLVRFAIVFAFSKAQMFTPIDSRLQFYVLSENFLEYTGNLESVHKKGSHKLNENYMIDVYVMFTTVETAHIWIRQKDPLSSHTRLVLLKVKTIIANYWLRFSFVWVGWERKLCKALWDKTYKWTLIRGAHSVCCQVSRVCLT